MARRIALLALAAVMTLAACGDDDTTTTEDTATTTTTPATTSEAPTTTDSGPAMAPSDVVFEPQTSDGTTIVVAEVTLPAPGFIAVHSNADGGPGPIIGHSELIEAGTWTDVVVELDTPLTETDLLFPMVHIDVDGDGVYEFGGDDNTDLPGMTADGSVAVTGAEVTVEGAEIEIEGFDFGDPITVSAGTEVTVRNLDGASHTWTSVDGVFDSDTLSSGGEFTFTFTEPGEYDFFCEIHPSMTGTITVTE